MATPTFGANGLPGSVNTSRLASKMSPGQRLESALAPAGSPTRLPIDPVLTQRIIMRASVVTCCLLLGRSLGWLAGATPGVVTDGAGSVAAAAEVTSGF